MFIDIWLSYADVFIIDNTLAATGSAVELSLTVPSGLGAPVSVPLMFQPMGEASQIAPISTVVLLSSIFEIPPSAPGTTQSLSEPDLSLLSAFAPISGKLIGKIKNGSYVDLKELLPDNAMLKQCLQELGLPIHLINNPGSSSRLREVQDPLSWVRCFLLYLAAKVQDQEVQHLATYAVTVIDLANAHGGQGWKLYDTHFRQQKAAGGSFPWTEINTSVMANTVFLHSSSGHCCELCLAPGHTCALNTIEHQMRSHQDQQ